MSQEDNTIYNAETFVLDKLFNKDGSEDYFMSVRELMASIDTTTMSPLLDQAMEELIAESLIRSEDGENYQITPDGINELKMRKSEPIPL